MTGLLDEIVADGVGDGLGTGLRRRLAHDAGDVVVDRVSGDTEDDRDLVAGLALGDPEQAFEFAFRQFKITVAADTAFAGEAGEVTGQQTDILRLSCDRITSCGKSSISDNRARPTLKVMAQYSRLIPRLTSMSSGRLMNTGCMTERHFSISVGLGVELRHYLSEALDDVERPVRTYDKIQTVILGQIIARKQIVSCAHVIREGSKPLVQIAALGEFAKPANELLFGRNPPNTARN